MISATQADKNIFLAGDFNIDILNYDKFNNTRKFFDDLLKKNLFPSIHKPTRVTQTSYSGIDNIFCNNLFGGYFEAGIFKTDISDHFPTFLIARDLCKIEKTTSTIFIRDLSKTKLDSLTKAYEETSWDEVLSCNDANVAFSFFSNKIQNIFDNVCHLSEKKVKPKELENPWMTCGLKKSSKRKQNLYNKFLKSRTVADNNIYKNYKNLFQKTLKKAKTIYYSRQLDRHKFDSKKTWKIINEVTGREKISNETFPKYIKHNGVVLHNKPNICTEFNKYFVNVGPKLASKIPQVHKNFKDFLGDSIESESLDSDLTYKEFDRSISYLKPNKAAGYDDLNSKCSFTRYQQY